MVSLPQSMIGEEIRMKEETERTEKNGDAANKEGDF